jgi:hypothetical protein
MERRDKERVEVESNAMMLCASAMFGSSSEAFMNFKPPDKNASARKKPHGSRCGCK